MAFKRITEWIKDLYTHPTKDSGECKHTKKKKVYADYQEGYIEYRCLKCGTPIYEDMYNV